MHRRGVGHRLGPDVDEVLWYLKLGVAGHTEGELSHRFEFVKLPHYEMTRRVAASVHNTTRMPAFPMR